MDAPMSAALHRLDDTNLTVADPAEDVRGRKVVDKAGEEIGKVEHLVIDDREHKVRFLEVGAGGFLGLGETKFLVPVDAIVRLDEDTVCVDQTRERVIGAPRYDPDLVRERDWEDLYGYYGFAPYWYPGYAPGAFPYFPPPP
jgi:sporulation protein YlmC with PRC-barrel domain